MRDAQLEYILRVLTILIFNVTYCFLLGITLRMTIDSPDFLLIWAGVWAATSILWFLIGDRYLLYVLNSRQFKDSELIRNIVDNNSCKYGNGNLNIFFSNRYQGNIFVCQGLFGRPSIILGTGIIKKLNVTELNSAVEMLSKKIQVGAVRLHTIGVLSYLLVFFIPGSIFLLLVKLVSAFDSFSKGGISRAINTFLFLYFVPFIYLRDKFFHSIVTDDNLDGSKNLTEFSLVNKIKSLDDSEMSDFVGDVSKSLSLCRRSDVNLSEAILKPFSHG